MTNTNNNTIARNTIFLSIKMVIVLLVSLYTSRVFLNVLGVVDYGISNIVAGFVSMFSFFNLSLSNGIQRFFNSEMGRKGEASVTEVYNTALVIQIIIAGVMLLLLESVGLWYIYEKLVIPPERFTAALFLYQFSIISAVLVILQTPYSAAVMAYERIDYYAIVNMIDVFLKLGLALIIPYVTTDRLITYGFFYVVVAFLNFLMYYVYSKRHFKYLYFRRQYKKNMFKEMLSFSGWNLLGSFSCIAREQGLNIILNLFFGPAVNAARGIAYQVSSALQGFVTNLSLAAKPQMVQSYAEGTSSRTLNLMNIMSKLSFLFLYILALPIIFNIEYILHLWLGNKVPEHTSSFIILVLLINFLNNLNAPLSNVVYATGKMRNYELTFSLTNLFIIPLAYFALWFGTPPETVFVVYLIMAIVVQIACLFVLKTLVNISLIRYCLDIIMPLMLVACVSFPLPYYVNFYIEPGILRIMTVFLVTLIVTFSFYYLFAMTTKEKEFVLAVVKKCFI